MRILRLGAVEQFLDGEYLQARVSMVWGVFQDVDAGWGGFLCHRARGPI